jgi:hypothetical protein
MGQDLEPVQAHFVMGVNRWGLRGRIVSDPRNPGGQLVSIQCRRGSKAPCGCYPSVISRLTRSRKTSGRDERAFANQYGEAMTAESVTMEG